MSLEKFLQELQNSIQSCPEDITDWKAGVQFYFDQVGEEARKAAQTELFFKVVNCLHKKEKEINQMKEREDEGASRLSCMIRDFQKSQKTIDSLRTQVVRLNELLGERNQIIWSQKESVTRGLQVFSQVLNDSGKKVQKRFEPVLEELIKGNGDN